MRAIEIRSFGGPEVLELREDAPEPDPGEHGVTRAGINFADTHARENTYLAPYELPLVPGAEVAAWAAAGELRVVEGETYPLSDAARAHADLQGHRTAGKLLLDPAR